MTTNYDPSGLHILANTALARIDLEAIEENLAVVRRVCSRSRIMAMVKADAYGHGLIQVARALQGADGLGVARFEEAVHLREAGIENRVMLLGTLLNQAQLAWCSEQHVDVCAHSQESVTAILAAARAWPLRVWLKLDSGMHRMGLDCTEFVEADRCLAAHRGIVELTHMTHFSSADETRTAALDSQLRLFESCHLRHPEAPVSLANSAALLSRPETHADWVRPGLMLYGINPLPEANVPLRPAMRLSSRVLSVRTISVGETVGYNRCWIAARRSRIATVGIGYGDGYPRHVTSGTPVWVNGRQAVVAGRVSMDSMGVDVSDCDAVAVGDEIVLWGPELSAVVVATYAATVPYALFTGVTPRVAREYRSLSA